MWFIIKKSYTLPVNEHGEPLEWEKWTSDNKKKAQLDAKVVTTLRCSLTKE